MRKSTKENNSTEDSANTMPGLNRDLNSQSDDKKSKLNADNSDSESDDEEALKAELAELMKESATNDKKSGNSKSEEVPGQDLNDDDFLDEDEMELALLQGETMVFDDEDLEDEEPLMDINEEEGEDGAESDNINVHQSDDTSDITLVGHEDPVQSCRLAKTVEGKIVAITGGEDDRLVFWDVHEEIKRIITAKHSSKDNIAESSEESTMESDENMNQKSISSNSKSDSKIIEMQASQKLSDPHTDTVVALELSSDSTLVASVGYDNEVHIRDVANPEKRLTALCGPGLEMEWGCWHPKGNVFLAGSADGTVWMWHAKKGACMNVYAGHGDGVSCGGFLCDGKYVVTGSKDGSVIIWHPKSASQLHNFQNLAKVGYKRDNMEVEYDEEEDSPEVVSLATIPVMKQFDSVTSSNSESDHSEPNRAFNTHISNPKVNGGNQAISSGSLFAVGTSVGSVHICQFDSESNTGKLVRSLQSHQDSAEIVAWQTHIAASWQVNIGPFLLTAGLDGVARIYDTKNWTVRKEIVAHKEGITYAQWLPSTIFGYYFVTCSVDGTVKLWNARTGELVRKFVGHQDIIQNIDCRMEGNELLLISCSDDASAKIWTHTMET